MSNDTACPFFLFNDSTSTCLTPPQTTPFYYSPYPAQFSFMGDVYLALVSPLVAYWGLSLVFEYFDRQSWKWLERARIHDSEEVKRRNLVGKAEVVGMVLFQQAIQTLAGVYWVAEESHGLSIDEGLKRVGRVLEMVVRNMLGSESSRLLLAKAGPQLVYYIYWWGIPAFQFFWAIFFIDTWQYALHRFMHTIPYLYRNVHSVHHRLYVPYAFGALYNHPVEGFLLDSVGALLAESATGMSTRQASLLFFIATLKTVDDHCGYRFPWDPLQMFSANNADYHDIHHQQIGIKHNFAQPFFIHWDHWLGTKMTRAQMEKLQQERRAKKL